MTRDYRHFTLIGIGKKEPFAAKTGGSQKHPSDVPDRARHAQKLLNALDHLPDLKAGNLPGVYLSVLGRPGEPMASSSLNASGLSLLNIRTNSDSITEATIFASPKGVAKLKEKIINFAGPIPVKKDGTKGRAKNADLVQSIDAIVEAGLRALWRSPQEKFPSGNGKYLWEIWISRENSTDFLGLAPKFGVKIGGDKLEFPEDVVVIAEASPRRLATLLRTVEGIKALAYPTTTADDFDDLAIEEQVEWVAEIQRRTRFTYGSNTGYITLLDRGVTIAHPLIQPALRGADRHAVRLEWDVGDIVGHGTELAGLALYGDLTSALQSSLPSVIRHRLESAKIIPDVGHNAHHLLGAMTRQGINAVEKTKRRRTFCLASTTEDDTPHDGAPTSWSSEVDQLASGVSGLQKRGGPHFSDRAISYNPT